MVVGQPSVAGLVAVGLLMLGFVVIVPMFIRNRRTIVNVSQACELSPEARVVTTKTPGHGGPVIELVNHNRPKVSLLAREFTKEPPMSQVAAVPVGSSGAGTPGLTPGRVAYLKLRAARARRRLVLTLVLLALTGAAWGYPFIPGVAYPWWVGLIPTGLLLAVLVTGRLAARAAKASDLAYRSGQSASLRQASANSQGQATYVNYSDDVEYEDDDFDFDDDDALPYINDQYVNEQHHLPVAATQFIPEVDQRLAVINNLKDDPELAETRWSLGTQQVTKRSWRATA